MDVEFEEIEPYDLPSKNMNELPDEVLEYIFSLVSPYKDLKECMLVCKRWHDIVKSVIRLLTLKLTNALNNMDVAWQTITPVEMAPSITKRHSHCACYHENSMYVFGGCTSTSTTFNDLWRLDLNKRQWVRPLTMGTYPSPKACASMVEYKDSLIVFGGGTLPSGVLFYQEWKLFNELHIYSIVKNRWMCISKIHTPPGMAAHSASVHGDVMVVFGGLKAETYRQHTSSNDVWCFNLETQEWHKQATTNVKPHARYGQSQIPLGEDHLLIIGGCGGSNKLFNDVWLLSLTGKVWTWREVEVQNREWSPTYMWCHRACRIGNQVVMMSRDPRQLKRKSQNSGKSKSRPRSSIWVPPEDKVLDHMFPQRLTPVVHVDKDSNVNGQRGSFVRPGSNLRLANRGAETTPSDLDSRPGTSGVKRSKHLECQKGMQMECEPGPSGTSSSSQAHRKSECEPGPSRLGLNNNTVKTVGLSPSKSENADHDSMSSPRSSSHNWDRLRPANRSVNGESANGVGGIQLAAFQSPDQLARNCPSRARERQLQALQRFEERMRFVRAQEQPNVDDVSTRRVQRTMVMCVMDITNVLQDECSVRWLTWSPEAYSDGPEETILYSLVAGRGELIMFGGIHRDAMTLMTNINYDHLNTISNLSNSLHFISAPHGVI